MIHWWNDFLIIKKILATDIDERLIMRCDLISSIMAENEKTYWESDVVHDWSGHIPSYMDDLMMWWKYLPRQRYKTLKLSNKNISSEYSNYFMKLRQELALLINIEYNHAIISNYRIRILLTMSYRSSRSLSQTEKYNQNVSSWLIWRMYELWHDRICRPSLALSCMISLWSEITFALYRISISKKFDQLLSYGYLRWRPTLTTISVRIFSLFKKKTRYGKVVYQI